MPIMAAMIMVGDGRETFLMMSTTSSTRGNQQNGVQIERPGQTFGDHVHLARVGRAAGVGEAPQNRKNTALTSHAGPVV